MERTDTLDEKSVRPKRGLPEGSHVEGILSRLCLKLYFVSQKMLELNLHRPVGHSLTLGNKHLLRDNRSGTPELIQFTNN